MIKFRAHIRSPQVAACTAFFVCFWVGVALQQACAKAPPTFGPQGTIAWQNLQIQKPLDLVRDLAIAGNETQPPIFTEAVTRKVVIWHRAAIVTLHARDGKWATVLVTGIDELQTTFSEKEKESFGPYLSIAKSLIQGVAKGLPQ